MTIGDLLVTIQSETGYVSNSLILKSSDSVGATYKWLSRFTATMATRREMFIAANALTVDVITDRVVIEYTEVGPAY